jgi:CHAT domain-containing protein
LVDRFHIAYASVAAVDKISTPKSLASAIVGANSEELKPMAFVKSEVNAIRRFYAVSDVQEASAEDYRDSILHLAAHADFSDSSPGDGDIPLANRRFSVQDALNAKTSSELVTLSATETAAGGLDSGFGAEVFNEAFIRAGSRSVVSNLWRYDDLVSGILMKRFYRNLADGIAVEEAFHSSQLAVKKNYPHPAYWSGFKLTAVR